MDKKAVKKTETRKESPREFKIRLEKERNARYEAQDKQLMQMQKAFTKLANNYSEFIGKMNKIIDKCEPIIDASLEQFKKA